jgi:Domain of unknown function (DUF4272)
MFGRSNEPPPLKRCSQCNAEMDADESVCPQCGHGLQEYAKRRRQALPAPPQIDLADLTEEWKVMTPAERRQVLRARIHGTDRTIFARIAKTLGMVRRPLPPPPRRVAARALVLAAVFARASMEMNLRDTHPESSGPMRDQDLDRLKRLGVASELEPEERAFLHAPPGRVDPVLVTNAAWRGEGLAVLVWGLNRLALPAYDEPASPPDRTTKSVGFEDLDVARELLNSATLRPPAEIERFATHTTVVTWRFRTFRMYPGPWDLIGYLRSQPSFKETWLEGLRVVDGDLAVGSQPIASAPAERVQACERIAVERQTAAYWLEGDDAVYSKVDPTTLLSAC